MKLIIKESTTNNITQFDNILRIEYKDLNKLQDKTKEEIIEEMVEDSKIVNLFNISDRVIFKIKECALEKSNIEELKEVLLEENIPLFSLIISEAERHRKKYNYLKEIEDVTEIFIITNKNNFLDAITLGKKTNKKVIISSGDISLKEYKEIFEKNDIDNLNKENIYIYYQEKNSPITINKLHEISSIIKEITDEILKYNLSPLEKTMYAYDLVKHRLYQKDNEDIHSCRDLDRVLTGDKIVCAGYSGLFNAILVSLGIKALPLITKDQKHQRSIAYIKDEKYSTDGIYVFDPTFDRRKDNNDKSYINRYNFFAMPFSRARLNYYDEMSDTLMLSRNKIKEIIDGEDIKTAIELTNKLIEIISFANPNYVHNEEYYIVDEMMEEYDKVIDKYNIEEIPMESFLKLVYNVRKIEFYSAVAETLDIYDIKDALFDRYKHIYIDNNKNKKDINELKINLVINALKIEDITRREINNLSIKEDIESIKLIKVLKKIKENKSDK